MNYKEWIYGVLIGLTFITIMIFSNGCSTTNTPITKVEYIEVKVPVQYRLDRPNRPIYSEDKSIPGYLNEVLTYSRTLEEIIDATNHMAQ